MATAVPKLNHNLLCSSLALATLLLCAQHTNTQTPARAETAPGAQESVLSDNQSVTGELQGGGIERYRVELLAGEYAHVQVEQRGVDVAVALYGPDGAELMVMSGLNGTVGTEEVSLQAPQTGWYVVAVLARTSDANKGNYLITLHKARRATTKERARIAAERLFMEGKRLYEGSNGPETLEPAAKKYQAALEKWREAEDRRWEALTLCGLGYVYATSNDYKGALRYFDEAAAMSRGINDAGGEGRAFIGLGEMYEHLSQYDKAREALEQALVIARNLKDRVSEGGAINELAIVYGALGQYEKARQWFEQALALAREMKQHAGEAGIMLNLAFVYERLGQYDKAREQFTRVRDNMREHNDPGGEAAALDGLGRLHGELREYRLAQDSYETALAVWRSIKNKSGEAGTLDELGAVLMQQNQYDQAENALEQALVLMRELREQDGEGQTLSNLMRLWSMKAERPLAIFWGKQAVNVYQDIRAHIKELEKESQQSFLHTRQDTYRVLADLLISEGRLPEAEQVLRMLKEEEYFDYLRRDDKVAKDLLSELSLTPRERDAFARYERFADELTKLGKEYGELQAESRNYEAGKFPVQARLDELEKQISDANKVFDAFLDQLKVKFGENDKRVDVLDSSQALLKELNQPRTVIIATIVGEDRLNLIVTTADAPRAHTVDIKARDLNELVTAFRAAVKNPAVDPRPLGKKLYDTLFPAALQNDLKNIKADTIVWSLDGTLRYAPIAALWDGKQYLAERYANVVITLASRDNLKIAPADRAKWQVLGVGVSKKFEDFDALTAVPEELCGIVIDPQAQARCATLTKGKSAGVITGRSLLDEEFTLQAFKSNLGRYAVVHVASHFSLNPGNETNSYLLLGGGKTDAERKLTIDVVRADFKTKFVGVELLTLSACNTAMTAGDKSNGVEIEGFGTLAQKEGAKAVLATLWSVADPSTRDLMADFYRRLQTNMKVSKAAALRQAQLSLLYGGAKENASDKNRKRADLVGQTQPGTSNQPAFPSDPKAPYAHPFYWAPFVLIGNWR